MQDITEEEWQTIHENFETTTLLTAVDKIDEVRSHLSDRDYCQPPEIRDDLLKLHQVAMEVVNKGYQDNETVSKLFDLANDLDMQLFEIMEAMEFVQNTIEKLTELYPESLDYS